MTIDQMLIGPSPNCLPPPPSLPPPFTLPSSLPPFLLHYPLSPPLTHSSNSLSSPRTLSPPKAKCIDRYTELRVGKFDSNDANTIDPRLEAVVNRMFECCLLDHRYKQAVGVALETRRIDILERAIHEAVSVCLL